MEKIESKKRLANEKIMHVKSMAEMIKQKKKYQKYKKKKRSNEKKLTKK